MIKLSCCIDTIFIICLIFRNVNNNAGIFDYLIGTAEDQETKEAALAYHFIRKAQAASTAAEVGEHIEAWLAKNFAVNIDFKIANALETLDRFGLVRRQGERLFVPPLEPSIARLHEVWSAFFKHSSKATNAER